MYFPSRVKPASERSFTHARHAVTVTNHTNAVLDYSTAVLDYSMWSGPMTVPVWGDR